MGVVGPALAARLGSLYAQAFARAPGLVAAGEAVVAEAGGFSAPAGATPAAVAAGGGAIVSKVAASGDEAVRAAVAQKVVNSAEHIFGRNLAKHELGGVLDAFGGDKIAAFQALERGVQTQVAERSLKATASGLYKTTVDVAGSTVTVEGRIIDGQPRIGTAYIPPRK